MEITHLLVMSSKTPASCTTKGRYKLELTYTNLCPQLMPPMIWLYHSVLFSVVLSNFFKNSALRSFMKKKISNSIDLDSGRVRRRRTMNKVEPVPGPSTNHQPTKQSPSVAPGYTFHGQQPNSTIVDIEC